MSAFTCLLIFVSCFSRRLQLLRGMHGSFFLWIDLLTGTGFHGWVQCLEFSAVH